MFHKEPYEHFSTQKFVENSKNNVSGCNLKLYVIDYRVQATIFWNPLFSAVVGTALFYINETNIKCGKQVIYEGGQQGR